MIIFKNTSFPIVYKNKLAASLKLAASYIVVFLIIITLSSCGKENAVPAYIHIPEIKLTTKAEQGSNAQKITEAWVFIDNIANGIYQLPVTFPVIELGERAVVISAGIRNNGIRSSPIIYPFYAPFTTKMNLKAGKTDTLRPSVSYVTDAKFWMNETFESGNSLTVNLDNNPSMNFTANTTGFEGKSGQAVLNKTTPIIEKASIIKAQIPPLSTSVYLELNYKTDTPLSVGIMGSSAINPSGTRVYKINLFPNKEWNKTYISLTDEVKTLNMTDYQVIFRSLMPDSLNTATILLDNVKLISK